MTPFPQSFLIYSLAALVLTGSFSRLTHGKYTPQFHAYQEYHHQDDGTFTARIVPFIDALLGTLLFIPRSRLAAAVLITFFFGVGLGVQMLAGKRFEIDVLSVFFGMLATVEAARMRRTCIAQSTHHPVISPKTKE